MTSTSGRQPDTADPQLAAEAARQLHAMLDALPPTTTRDRATARRLEGAAIALESFRTPAGGATATGPRPAPDTDTSTR